MSDQKIINTPNSEVEVIRIFIIDDDRRIIDTLSNVFEASDLPVDIYTAMRGNDALKLFETVIPNIVILDANLPDILGADIFIKIRKMPYGKNIKFIAISGVPFALETMKDLGVDFCLAKPFKIADLIAAVQLVSEKNVKIH